MGSIQIASSLWKLWEIDRTFTGGADVIDATGTLAIYTPPAGEIHLVRGVVAWGDVAAGDPLRDSGATGSTQVAIGGNNGLSTQAFVSLQAFALWSNSAIMLGNGGTGSGAESKDDIVLVGPPQTGKPLAERSMTVRCNAGSVIGTLHVRFQYLKLP